MKKATLTLLMLVAFSYLYHAKSKDMVNIQEEIWKDVVGYEGYYKVSNLGRVKSLPRKENSKRNWITIERILSDKVSNIGYVRVVFHDRKKHSVHRLVMIAFVANPDNKPQVNHINGIRNDNRLVNLEWATSSENAKHAYSVLGVKPSRTCKLSLEDVYAIRLASKSGIRGDIIHSLYFPQVSYGAISDIISRRRWAHV